MFTSHQFNINSPNLNPQSLYENVLPSSSLPEQSSSSNHPTPNSNNSLKATTTQLDTSQTSQGACTNKPQHVITNFQASTMPSFNPLRSAFRTHVNIKFQISATNPIRNTFNSYMQGAKTAEGRARHLAIIRKQFMGMGILTCLGKTYDNYDRYGRSAPVGSPESEFIPEQVEDGGLDR